MAGPADKSTALWVLKNLREAGFQALLAGGCVRDMLLGKRPTDYDIATSATPRQVKKLFGNVLLIGAKFGVAMVIHKGRQVEVATFRSDESYSDGRRPDAVRFCDPQQDALRRDFTINGMFLDPFAPQARRVMDFVGGRADLRRRIIRTIGDPDQRFGEDYLRMIRAVRFAARLDFKIVPATAEAIRRHGPKIVSTSGERIYDELSKMLSHPSAVEAMARLERLSLAKHILPELFDQPAMWPLAMKRLAMVARPGALPVALGAVFAGLPVGTIGKLVRRWGESNHLRKELCYYSRHLDGWPDAESLPLREFKRLMSGGPFENIQALWRAAERIQTGRQVQSRRIARRAGGIPAGLITPPPFVTGGKLIEMGITEGPKLGRLLRRIYDAQLDEQVTTRRQAINLARKMITRQRGGS